MDDKIWKPISTRICNENKLFHPSYPSLISLARSLTRANLLISSFPADPLGSLSHSVTGTSSASSEQVDTPAIPPRSRPYSVEVPSESERYSVPYLVPGGRFLLVADMNQVSIWDVGPPGYPPQSPRLIGTRELHLGAVGKLHLHALCLGVQNTIRVTIASKGRCVDAFIDPKTCF